MCVLNIMAIGALPSPLAATEVETVLDDSLEHFIYQSIMW
jgi:hypothetical protein